MVAYIFWLLYLLKIEKTSITTPMNNGLWQAFHVMSIAILDTFIVDAH